MQLAFCPLPIQLSQPNGIKPYFLDIVNNQIDIKEKRIQVLVTGMPVIKSPHTNISITTIDMKKTKARKKGAGSWNEIMDWEKDFGRERNRGTII